MIQHPPLISPAPIPDEVDQRILRVLDYWREKRELCSTEFPRLKDIQMMDLHTIAPHLLIADVIREPDQPIRYRWRYWGTALTQFFGYEMSGSFIHEAYTQEAHDLITGAYQWVLENKDIHFWVRQGGLAYEDQEHLKYLRLVCPLEGETGNIDHLFGIITFANRHSSSNPVAPHEDIKTV